MTSAPLDPSLFRFDPDAGGLLLVDKPLEWTSFDAVGKIRAAMRAASGRRVKVGHAGTLDPLATGLLVLGFGPYTKQLTALTGLDKTYVGTMTLGATTPSYDLETTPQDHGPWEGLSVDEIHAAFARFTGSVEQRPPAHSAKRVDGERAYLLVRDEKYTAPVEVAPVQVQVHRLEVTAVDGPRIHFEAEVAKGTYIRSLAHDIGQVLGCGAHLSMLRRTRVGPFDVAHALSPADWAQLIAPR